jgi:hypothetical protein
MTINMMINIWPFWLGWTAANAIGWAVGLTVENAAQLALEAASGGVLVASEGGLVQEAIAGLLFGLPVGAMQWLALRRRIAGTAWWIPATAGGFILAGIVGGALQDIGAVVGVPVISFVGGLVISFGLGLAAGTLQWLILRRQVKHAGWWVPASAILVFASLITGLAAAMALTGEGPGVSVSGAAFAAVAGAAFGLTSGLVLVRLLRQPALMENFR